MSDKTKTDFLEENSIPTCVGRHSIGLNGMLKAMQAYANQETRKANELIKDIAKLLGEDGLGFDGISWTVDDFKSAIVEEKRKEAMSFMSWVWKEGYYVPNSNTPRTWCNGPRNDWPQMCYTDDELFDLYK
jgi:hypothetical protein